MTTPADIVNRVFDAIGRPELALGDLSEGTEGAKPGLRAYGPAVRQLLRAAPWGFARKQAKLSMLADRTGQTPDVGCIVPAPWVYEYQYPIDCVKARFLPWNWQEIDNAGPPGNISIPPVPQTTGTGNPPLYGVGLRPAPFLIALDYNYPVTLGGSQGWDQGPNWWDVQGTGPGQRTVVLSNVNCAWLVYTALVIYPSQWDDLFTEALVHLLTSRLAMPLSNDKKFGLQLRNEASQSAREAVSEARLVNANESGFPQTTDHTPDWIRIRTAGARGNWGGNGSGFNGPGVLGYGFDSLQLGDGSVY